jgi:glycosyltransferase involved in cell wall biosynthesis
MFEVLVVDNGSEPPLSLDGIAGNVLLLREPKPGSYNARNLALRHATGRILAFTDANCVADPVWLEAAIEALVAAGGPAFVAGHITVKGRQPNELGPIEAYEEVTCFNQEISIKTVGCGATANLITTRETMEMTGEFDTYFSGGDFLWCKRAVSMGAKPLYSAAARVVHPTRGSRRAVLARERRLVGGHRDISPGFWPCVRYVIRHLKPPRQNICGILRLPSERISLGSRLLAILFAIEARLHMGATRAWLGLTNGRSTR